jgi:hypothetical protein
MPFTIAAECINLAKYVENIYAENYKTVVREIK